MNNELAPVEMATQAEIPQLVAAYNVGDEVIIRGLFLGRVDVLLPDGTYEVQTIHKHARGYSKGGTRYTVTSDEIQAAPTQDDKQNRPKWTPPTKSKKEKKKVEDA